MRRNVEAHSRRLPDQLAPVIEWDGNVLDIVKPNFSSFCVARTTSMAAVIAAGSPRASNAELRHGPGPHEQSGTIVSGVHLCSLLSSSARKMTTTRNPKRKQDGHDQLVILRLKRRPRARRISRKLARMASPRSRRALARSTSASRRFPMGYLRR